MAETVKKAFTSEKFKFANPRARAHHAVVIEKDSHKSFVALLRQCLVTPVEESEWWRHQARNTARTMALTRRILIVALVLGVHVHAAAAETFGCNICGCEGCTFTNPTGVVSFLYGPNNTQEKRPCNQLQQEVEDETLYNRTFCLAHIPAAAVGPCRCVTPDGDLISDLDWPSLAPNVTITPPTYNVTSFPTAVSNTTFPPTMAPNATLLPTMVPNITMAPTLNATYFPTMAPNATFAPTLSPTNATFLPTMAPNVTTNAPTSAPTMMPNTTTAAPTSVPTVAPTNTPTASPVAAIQTFGFVGVTIRLEGAKQLSEESRAAFEDQMEEFYRKVYNNPAPSRRRQLQNLGVSNFDTSIAATGEDFDTLGNTITYDQIFSFTSDLEVNEGVARDLLVAPLSNDEGKRDYLDLLTEGNADFASATGVDAPVIPNAFPDRKDDDSDGAELFGLDILVVVLILVGLLCCFGCCFVGFRRGCFSGPKQGMKEALDDDDDDSADDFVDDVDMGEGGYDGALEGPAGDDRGFGDYGMSTHTGMQKQGSGLFDNNDSFQDGTASFGDEGGPSVPFRGGNVPSSPLISASGGFDRPPRRRSVGLGETDNMLHCAPVAPTLPPLQNANPDAGRGADKRLFLEDDRRRRPGNSVDDSRFSGSGSNESSSDGSGSNSSDDSEYGDDYGDVEGAQSRDSFSDEGGSSSTGSDRFA